MPLVQRPDLEMLLAGFAMSYGADTEESRIFAQCLAEADARGRSTQGIVLLDYYRDLFDSGSAKFGVPLVVRSEGAAYAVIDAGHLCGQVAATRAMRTAIAKARGAGLAASLVSRAGDFGMAGAYALEAARAGLIGLAMSSGPPRVAPWGGQEALLCTNPIAFSAPGSDFPILVDQATSAISVGELVTAARAGREFESPVAVDNDGRFVRDPRLIITDLDRREPVLHGALLSDGSRGYGWSLLVEILGGLLTGQPTGTAEQDAGAGIFLLALDPLVLMGGDSIVQAVDTLVARLTDSASIEGVEAVLVPGQRSAARAREAARRGVPIELAVWERATAVCSDLGVAIPVASDQT